jgi:hypothetical protein
MKNTLQIVEHLRRALRCSGGSARPRSVVSTGCEALDRLLPWGGLRVGSLTEWLAGSSGSGAATLATITAREASRDGGAIVLLDRDRRFYPPAAWALGIDPRRLIVVQPRGVACSLPWQATRLASAEEVWAIDQSLRCPAVAAVVASIGKLDVRSFRRLQLAAESGSSVGLLLRPASVLGEPGWADLRLLVQPRPFHDGRRLQVSVVRFRGGPAAHGTMELEVDEVTGVVREARSAPCPECPCPETASR